MIENENSMIKQKLKELIQKLKEAEMLHEKTKKQNLKLKKKINKFRCLLKDLTLQLNQKIEDVEKANQTISKLNSKISKLQNIQSIEIDLVKTQHLEQSKQTNDKLLMLEDKFHLIQKNYSFCNDENKRLQYQLKQASRDINRLESENAKYPKTNAASNGRNPANQKHKRSTQGQTKVKFRYRKNSFFTSIKRQKTQNGFKRQFHYGV